MFSNQFLMRINQQFLEFTQFRENDFVVTSSRSSVSGSDKYHLEIVYRFNPEYRYLAAIDYDEEPVQYHRHVDIVMCPGYTYRMERDEITSEKLLSNIRSWLDRIHAELVSAPYKRDLQEQQEQIDEILGQLENLPRDYFSREEGERLRQKLDDLEAQLLANLNESIEDKDELKQKTEVITKDMEVLKDNIAALSKRGWTASLIVRTLDWLKDPTNRKVLTSGAQVAKDILLETGKHLPDGK